MIKILVITDQFPTDQINDLLTHSEFDIDILINPATQTDLMSHPNLGDLNLLIFNPQFNYLNTLNHTMDGQQFNHLSPIDLLLTTQTGYDWSRYDLSYVILNPSSLQANLPLIQQKWWPIVCQIPINDAPEIILTNPKLPIEQDLTLTHQLYQLCQAPLTLNPQLSAILDTLPIDVIDPSPVIQAHVIFNLITHKQLRTCVNLGTWRGRALQPMILANPQGHNWGYDPYQTPTQSAYSDDIKTLLPLINYEHIYQQQFPNKNCQIVREFSQIPTQIDLLTINCLPNQVKPPQYLTNLKPQGYLVVNHPSHETILTLDLTCQRLVNSHENWSVWQKNKAPSPHMTLAIVIATYDRPQHATLPLLCRCLQSIIKQSYPHWVIYLVGDQVPHFDHWIQLIQYNLKIPEAQLKVHNKLDPERHHIKDKNKLWMIAGASAMNYGLNWSRQDKHYHYVHLDDDDYWEHDHLWYLAHVYQTYPQCVMTFTQSTYPDHHQPLIPYHPDHPDLTIFENNCPPRCAGLVHSSASFRSDIIPYDYFTTHEEDLIYQPADGIMWDRINQFLTDHNQYTSIYIPILTCHHDEEGASKN